MTIIIKNSSGMPIYEQIKEQIKEAILNDEMNEGDMLPSIRQLAADLKVSVITTTRAYTELETEGYVYNVQGKGCYVAPKDSDLIREQLIRKIEDSFTGAINAARIAKLPKDELEQLFQFTLEGSQYE
ncbi:MAG: GntR family transcriptional regulator [Defluviitaleaceae bacterium]|nr:GntR family transcriptional regulator [Defluviitaleaceae bacterium]